MFGSDDPRVDGYLDLAGKVLGPHRDYANTRARIDSHSRAIFDAAVAYRLAVEVREPWIASSHLDRLRALLTPEV